MRKIWTCLLALILALTPLAASAADYDYEEKNEETGYRLIIQDDAGLLKTGESEKVTDAMRGITAYASVGFYTVSSGGSSTASATKAQKWGDGVFGPGTRYTVFIIDMSTRHLDIYASKPLAAVLTAAEENSIADNVYKYASDGAYGTCAAETFRQIERVLKGEKIATPMKYVSNIFIALIAAILAAYLLISAWVRKEQAVSMPDVVRAAGIGAATVITANTLKKVVHHQSSSGGHGGGFGGGGGFSGGGGSSGGHGF